MSVSAVTATDMPGFEPTKTEVTPGHVLMGVRLLKCPPSAGHISELCRGKCQNLCYSPVASAGGVGGGSNSKYITYKCLHVYMHMVYLYFRRQFEAVPAYVMSQRWLTSILDNTCEGRACN